jgi:hypothetical protein
LSDLLKVTLGEISFALCGLKRKHKMMLRSAWGPFVAETQATSDLQSDLTASHVDHVVYFFYSVKPREMESLYERGDDVAIAYGELTDGIRAVNSWIDGSLGSIEATVQVLLQWTLAQGGGLLMHASAGVYQGQGWLIPGVSGAGKSTSVREGGFDLVLSDEMVIVKPVPSKSDISTVCTHYRLSSTPFWSEGRTLPLVVAEAPLNLVGFPIKAKRAQLLPCSSTKAVSLFLQAVTAYERLGSEAEKLEQNSQLFEHACRVIELTPHRGLAFPKYGPWRALISDT